MVSRRSDLETFPMIGVLIATAIAFVGGFLIPRRTQGALWSFVLALIAACVTWSAVYAIWKFIP